MKVLKCPICNKSDFVKLTRSENGTWTFVCTACREEALRRLAGIDIKGFLENYARANGDSDMMKAIAERNWNHNQEEEK
ncbi:MAG: hypothetical protein IJG38_01920 [Thermoguttaceae bacterium]|nr:hypothetical protein [Thermoguttaceae bacterium]